MNRVNDSERVKDHLSEDHIDEGLLKAWVEGRRKYLWRKRVARFLELHPLAWFFDEYPPQDIYKSISEDRRSTRQNVRYHWLRQRTGWSFLSQLKTSAGVRFASVAGLVSAIFQASPNMNIAGWNGMPFRWLLLAGLFYLVAVVLIEVFTPLLLKLIINYKDDQLGHHGRQWFRTLVEDELRRWWSKREWWPHPDLLDLTKMEDRAVLGIMSGHGVPAYSGFGFYASAHIELALEEFSKARNLKLWRVDRYGQGLSKFQSSGAREGNRPRMQHLCIRRPNLLELKENPCVSEADLMVQWFFSSVDISHLVPRRRDLLMSEGLEGLMHFFACDEDAICFSSIVARWQNSMHPWRRLSVIFFYMASLFCFAWFVVLQVVMVFEGLRFFA